MRVVTSSPRMYTDEHGLKHRELTETLIGIFFSIYNELGHGFLESVYEQAFAVALAENGIFFERQIAVPVWFHGQKVGDFRADLLVAEKVIVELKTGRLIDSAWEKQLLNYLCATQIRSVFCSTLDRKPNSIAISSKKNPRKSALIRGDEVS